MVDMPTTEDGYTGDFIAPVFQFLSFGHVVDRSFQCTIGIKCNYIDRVMLDPSIGHAGWV